MMNCEVIRDLLPLYVDDACSEETRRIIDKHTQDHTNLGPVILGQDSYFVMGDNRGNSNDSRRIGPLTRDMILGHVRCTLWPLSKFLQKVE